MAIRIAVAASSKILRAVAAKTSGMSRPVYGGVRREATDCIVTRIAGRIMANPFATSRWFHKVGHATNTMFWRLIPTPAGLAVITTTGRKTGRHRQRAIRAVGIRAAGTSERLYAVAMLGQRSDWLHNIRANPAVRIKLGRRTYDAAAREVVDPDERQEAAEAYVRIAGSFDYFDYANLRWSLPSRDRVLQSLEEVLDTGVPVVFEIQP
jgi:deazaflavin-dependent oxidoreductase (nitroreductase family)